MTGRSSTTSAALPFLNRLTRPLAFSSTRKSWSLRNCICTGCASPVVTVRTSSFGSTTDGAGSAPPPARPNASAPAAAADPERPSHCLSSLPPELFIDPPSADLRNGIAEWFDATLRRMLERRTKIVATLGPPTDPPGVLDALMAAGLDCARLNCSHGDARRPAPPRRRRARRGASAPAARSALLFDLQGPKLRLSGDTEPRAVAAGDVVTFVGAGAGGAHDRVVVDFHAFAALVTERSQIVIGDGVPRFARRVARRRRGHRARRLRRAARPAQGHQRHLRAARAAGDHRQGPRRPRARRRAGRDFVALSFVRSAADIELLRTLLRERGSRRADDRQDREDRGLRAPRRDPRASPTA